jgi:hypothetical protein
MKEEFMWLLWVIIGQFVGAVAGAFVINLIWMATHPGQGWCGK